MLDSGRLPGAIAFASAPTRRNPLGTPGLAAKSSISLLSITPRPGNHQSRAKKEVDRHACDAIAFRVDHREVRRLLAWLSRRFPCRHRLAWRGPSGSRRAGQLRSTGTSFASGTSTKSGSPRYSARSRCARRIASTTRCLRVAPSSASWSKPDRILSVNQATPPEGGGGAERCASRYSPISGCALSPHIARGLPSTRRRRACARPRRACGQPGLVMPPSAPAPPECSASAPDWPSDDGADRRR